MTESTERWEPWRTPSIVQTSGPSRVSDDHDPTYKPRPFLGFASPAKPRVRVVLDGRTRVWFVPSIDNLGAPPRVDFAAPTLVEFTATYDVTPLLWDGDQA